MRYRGKEELKLAIRSRSKLRNKEGWNYCKQDLLNGCDVLRDIRTEIGEDVKEHQTPNKNNLWVLNYMHTWLCVFSVVSFLGIFLTKNERISKFGFTDVLRRFFWQQLQILCMLDSTPFQSRRESTIELKWVHVQIRPDQKTEQRVNRFKPDAMWYQTYIKQTEYVGIS